jgi:hypothetical protein
MSPTSTETRIELCIRELVDRAPELSPEQCDRLAVLLRPSGRTPDSGGGGLAMATQESRPVGRHPEQTAKSTETTVPPSSDKARRTRRGGRPRRERRAHRRDGQ